MRVGERGGEEGSSTEEGGANGKKDCDQEDGFLATTQRCRQHTSAVRVKRRASARKPQMKLVRRGIGGLLAARLWSRKNPAAIVGDGRGMISSHMQILGGGGWGKGKAFHGEGSR